MVGEIIDMERMQLIGVFLDLGVLIERNKFIFNEDYGKLLKEEQDVIMRGLCDNKVKIQFLVYQMKRKVLRNQFFQRNVEIKGQCE